MKQVKKNYVQAPPLFNSYGEGRDGMDSICPPYFPCLTNSNFIENPDDYKYEMLEIISDNLNE